ncbi:MAG: flagellar brake protein [Clostridiaceae bacterium]
MDKIHIDINNRIEVKIENVIYKSTIQDILEDSIAISIPSNKDGYLPLVIDDNISVLLYNKTNNVFQFKSKVLKKTIDKIPLIYISRPTSFKKIQRRDFVRVSYVNVIDFAKIDKIIENVPNDKLYDLKFDIKQGHILDISGGGIKFSNNKNLELNDKIIVYIPLSGKKVMAKCNIVRKDFDALGRVSYGLIFIDISPKDQEEIIQFVFGLMRKMRKSDQR